MLAAALPQPTTRVRPFGGFGRYAGSDLSGSAAAIAASNMARSRDLGSIVIKPQMHSPRRHEDTKKSGDFHRGPYTGRKALSVQWRAFVQLPAMETSSFLLSRSSSCLRAFVVRMFLDFSTPRRRGWRELRGL